MLNWAKKVGKKLSDSMINCLREMAVAALKAEQPCAEAKKMLEMAVAAIKAEQPRVEAKEIE